MELPDGSKSIREVVEHPGAAVIVPVDSEGRVHLVRQYRDAAAQEMLEVPAGKLHPGEDPSDCARRELAEELGLESGKLTHLASFYSSPGFCDEVLHAYMAQELVPVQGEVDREEFLEPEMRQLDPVGELVRGFKDAKSIIGVLLASRELGKHR